MRISEGQAALAARSAQNEGSWYDPVVGALKYVGVFTAGYVLAANL